MTTRNLSQLAAAVPDRYKNFKIVNVNDANVRMSVMEGLYDWHVHSNSDEFFLVMEGELQIEFKAGSVFKLGPQDSLLVPKGTIHRTYARVRTVSLTFNAMNTTTDFMDQSRAVDQVQEIEPGLL